MDVLEELKERYFQNLRVLNYSPGTIESHGWRMKPFLNYLRNQGVQDPKGITFAVVRSYQKFLYDQLNKHGKQNSVSYRNNQLIVAKQFLKFLAEEKVIDEDPSKDVSYAIEPKRLPRTILSGPEVKKLLAAPDKTTVIGFRDRVILEVFYSSALRKAELQDLRVTDIDLSAGVMRINHGKGGKDRVIPIGKVAIKYLRYYLDEVRPRLVKDPTVDYLFLSALGRRIARNTLGDRIKRHVQKAGIEKHITPHSLRATCATHCLRGKSRKEQMHPRHLMELLGHASMESLTPYLSVSIEDLKEAHHRCHPREKEPLPGKKTVAKQAVAEKPDLAPVPEVERTLEDPGDECYNVVA